MGTIITGEILSKLRRAQNQAQESLNKAKRLSLFGDLSYAAKLRSCAARSLQMAFEKIPGNYYFEPEIHVLVKKIAELRKNASDSYLDPELNDYFNAAIDLSRAARCQESVGRYLITSEKTRENKNLTDLAYEFLMTAKDYRFSAIEYLRTGGCSPLQLAYELSYASNALTFLMSVSREFDNLLIVNQTILFRCEASIIFEKEHEFEDAYFEYRHLRNLFSEEAVKNPSYYGQLAFCSLKALEMGEKGKLDSSLFRNIKCLKTATHAYRRMARIYRDGYSAFYQQQAEELRQRALEAENNKIRKPLNRLADPDQK